MAVASAWDDAANSDVTTPADAPLPDDVETLKAMLLAERQAYGAKFRNQALQIEKLEHQIAQLRHERFGQSSERRALLDQLELQLFELKEEQAQAETSEEIASPQSVTVPSFERRKPSRRPLPEHLPRERVVYPMPAACPCCGGALHKLGEDVTETLELVPRQWKVIQHVREKHSCRSCEKITQPPAPSHPIARGRAGPGLLAHVLFAKYGLHLPLTRQSATYAREGIELDVSTLADWVGASAATLMPLVEAVRGHVFAAERLHADDTTVPVLDVGRTRTGRLWTYVRDDRPFAGAGPPAAAYFYSPDRRGEHPEAHLVSWAGLMQADAYAGYDRLYEAGRRPGPIVEAACWAHARRKFFDLARLNKAPIAIEAVARIDALFAIERDINGLPPDERRAVRHERSRPRVEALGTWLREQHARLSPQQSGRQGDRLQPQRLGRAGPLPRRWPPVPDQQRRRAGAALHRHRSQQLDLRWLRRRRPARRGHLHPDRDRQAQRRRSAGLARRRARTSAGPPGQAHRRAAALELETAATAAATSGRLKSSVRSSSRHQLAIPWPPPDAYS